MSTSDTFGEARGPVFPTDIRPPRESAVHQAMRHYYNRDADALRALVAQLANEPANAAPVSLTGAWPGPIKS